MVAQEHNGLGRVGHAMTFVEVLENRVAHRLERRNNKRTPGFRQFGPQLWVAQDVLHLGRAVEGQMRVALVDGGNDPAMRVALIQAYFAAKDFANAEKELLDQMASEEKAKEVPPEAQYQLLINCYLGQNDMVGYVATMEKTVLHYPKPEYWADLIRRSSTKPGFASSRLELDVYRLKLATGTLKSADDYREMTQGLLQQNLPGESKDVIDQGFAAGLLGKDEKAVRDNKLRDLAIATVTADQAAIEMKVAAAVEAKDAQAMIDLGFDYVGYGQFDKGIKLMEDAIRAGGQKHPEDGKLHLALAYLRAGQKPKALDMLKTVDGTDGTADLAHLWLLVNTAKPAS